MHAGGTEGADLRFEKKPVPFRWRALYRLAHLALFRALKDRPGCEPPVGVHRRAALGPDVFRFFHAMGVPLKQIYGQTEIAGISCIHRDGEHRVPHRGRAHPRDGAPHPEEGEILSRSPSVFLGYYKNEAGDAAPSPAAGSTPATPAISPKTATSS